MDIPHRKSIGASRSMLPAKAMQRSKKKNIAKQNTEQKVQQNVEMDLYT